MSKPKQGRQNPPAPGRPWAGGVAGHQPADLLARIEDAETRLKQLISEAHGLTGDLKSEARRYKDAHATLENLMTDIIGHRDELEDAVRDSFRKFVERETERTRAWTQMGLDAQLAAIESMTADVKKAIQNHEAKLLGCESADELMGLLAEQMFNLLKKDIKNRESALVGVPVDCPENRVFVVTAGLDPAKLPWDKDKGSVRDVCEIHHGPVWLGPELQKKRDQVTKAGQQALVTCVVCVARLPDGNAKLRTIYGEQHRG